MSTSVHAGYIIVNHAAERLLTHNSLPVHKPIVWRDARVCTGIDRVIELSYTSHEDPTVGVGKLSKITDKYSASNERLALWLDLTILIMARRAQRRGFLLLSPCESLSFLSRPRRGRFFSSDYTPVLEYFLVFVMEIVIFDEFLNVYLGLFVSCEAL